MQFWDYFFLCEENLNVIAVPIQVWRASEVLKVFVKVSRPMKPSRKMRKFAKRETFAGCETFAHRFRFRFIGRQELNYNYSVLTHNLSSQSLDSTAFICSIRWFLFLNITAMKLATSDCI